MRGQPRSGADIASATPSTLIDYGYSLGHTEFTHLHIVNNPLTEPTIALMQLEYISWGKFTAGSPPTPVSYDPVSVAIDSYTLPELLRYLTTALRSSAVSLPSESDLVSYFDTVEYIYQLLGSVKLVHDLYYHMNWSQIRRDGLNVPPPEIAALAGALGVLQPQMQILWGPYFDRLAAVPCLPNALRHMDRIFSAHVMSQQDRVIRFYAPWVDDVTANFAAAGTTIRSLVEAGLSLLEVTYADSANFLRHYLPWTAGLPQMRFVGVDPLKTQQWWNMSLSQMSSPLETADATTAAGRVQIAARNLQLRTGTASSWTTAGNMYSDQVITPLHFDTYLRQVSVAELLFMDAYLVPSFASNDHPNILNMTTLFPGVVRFLQVASGGMAYDNHNWYSMAATMELFTTVQGGMAQLAMGSLMPKRWIPTSTTGLPTQSVANPVTPYSWQGRLHPELTPARVGEDEYRNVMLRVFSQVTDYSVLAQLTARAAGGFPKPVHPGLIDAFVGQQGQEKV